MTLENDLLNIRQASERTGLSEMTIRKYLGLGKPAKPSRLPNARKVSREGKETWEIPLSDLFNAGLMSSKATATETATQSSAEVSQAESVAVLKAENEALKVQIALLERNLGDLREEIRFSRRAIETGEEQARRRLFWQRPKS